MGRGLCASVKAKNMQVLSGKPAAEWAFLNRVNLEMLFHTHHLFQGNVFLFLKTERDGVVCCLGVVLAVWMSVCNVFKNDVPLPMSSNHMKQMWLTDPLALLAFQFWPPLRHFLLKKGLPWGSGPCSRNVLQRTPKGRHELAHIWGQKPLPFIQPLWAGGVDKQHNGTCMEAHSRSETDGRALLTICPPLSPFFPVTEIAMSL